MQENRQAPRDPRRVGAKEDIINFRPSPNFKNMKKFLKNRSDYNETASSSSSSPGSSVEPAVQQKPETQAEVKPTPTVFQPPLPTYPPPDSPPYLNVTIKKEQEDEPENQEEEAAAEASINFQEITATTGQPQAQPKQEDRKPKKPAMCKEYIRGECTRPVCRFSHELDLNQLHGVFTFCWNFQNARCTHPSCKFVHATIFEEAEFYRTGILPAHARAHLKKLPPPPPPPEENKNGSMMPPNNIMNPLPNMHPEQQIPMMNCVPPRNMEVKPEDYLANTSPPLKLSSLPRDLDHNDHLAIKCKNCDIMEFRLQYKKEKVEELIQNKEETDKEMNILDKKCKKLASVLLTILKPASLGNNTMIGGGLLGDKDKMFAEQFENINRSFANNDMKNNYGSSTNLQSFLSKLLCKNGDASLPADVARES